MQPIRKFCPHYWGRCVTAIAVVTLLTVPVAAQSGTEVAKVASIQNVVETKSGDSNDWATPSLRQKLFANDRIRTGPASRAAILYSDKTLHRLNENSELEVLAPGGGDGSGVLRVISGGHYFSSRTPKDYGRVETPTVTAAIKGTEFAVQVEADGTTTISMFEGVVEASNSFGTIDIGRGEQAFVEPGKAPVRRILVRPRDAVTWTLYYPSILGGRDADRLASMGADGDALAQAAALLGSGQVDQARPLIDQVRSNDAKNPIALALSAIIEIASDNKDEARRLADEAREADPESAAAALAVSFAAQAQFDIETARKSAEAAAGLDEESAVALARAAELLMAEGDIAGAKRQAERAVRRDPDSARALAVLGFVQLAEYRTGPAEETFRKAVEADSSLALARVGLGISQIRRGSVDAGREELQTAAILDPYNSLIRSYLAKAYYEEKREREASVELATAKELDPLDPTPYLYDAILKQNENRPVEALEDLRKSVELNDRRAVYRSRMLLDQDRAVRAADLARVYNDLGFEQLGLVSARRSADQDQSNYSAHMLMAGNYRNLAGFAPAFLSESLQARIYQPISVNAARPDIVSESVSFNEYTALFDRARVRGFGGATFGDTETDLGELIPDGSMCADFDGNIVPCKDFLELGSSQPRNIDVVGTINRDRFAAAISYQDVQDDGFRFNTDSERQTYRAFATFAPSPRDTIQINLQRSDIKNGDLPLREFPLLITPERFDTELDNYALGYHRIVSPSADLAISVIYNRTEQTGSSLVSDASATATLEGPQIEGQYVWRRGRATWTFGGGSFNGEQELSTATDRLTGDDTFVNGYAYVKIRELGKVEVTAGFSYEDVVAPLGLLPARDSVIGPAELEYSQSQVSPKLGVSWFVAPKTVLRLGAYSRLSPAIGRVQSLEPTQVSGFNQFFDEPGGTSSDSVGVGWDQEFGKRIFGGISLLYRDMTVPEAYCDTPDQFSGCGFQQANIIVERDAESWVGQAYINATVGKNVALSAEYIDDNKTFDFTQVSPIGFFEDEVETTRFVPQVRAFFRMGLFAAVRATYYDQTIHQFDDLTSPDRTTIGEDFWIGDIELGYRFPKRYGSISLRVLNATDEKFAVFLNPIETQLIPTRTILLGINVQN